MFGRFLVKSTLVLVLACGLGACKGDQPVASTPAQLSTTPMDMVDLPAKARSLKLTEPFNPEEVILLDGQNKTVMHYLVPQMRTAVRGLGFGGTAQYAVLRGLQATLRLPTRTPVFLFAVPAHAQPESYFNVASFADRKNGTREVIIGGGFMSYSTGISQDRIIPTSMERLADQSKAPKDFTVYLSTPKAPLAQGEYALVFYNSQIKVTGFFSSAMDSYFDFGVD